MSKVSRRKALSTAGKVAVGVVGAGVVAGVAGYFVGSGAAPPSVVTRTVTVGGGTVTVPSTVTRTVTAGVEQKKQLTVRVSFKPL